MSLPSSDAAEHLVAGGEGGVPAVVLSTIVRALLVYVGTHLFAKGVSFNSALGGAIMIEVFVLLVAVKDSEGKG